jgi:3-oxoacyl-[acyl-carrier protein] reductase
MSEAAGDGSTLLTNGRLDGQTILVTGASRGIGAAIAVAAATVGADVGIAYNVEKDRAEEVASAVTDLGRKAEIFSADVADPVAARAMVRSAEQHFGKIDGLVNNAGIMPITDFLDISDEEWQRVLDTDVTSAFACSQAVLPGMLDRGKGSIVMVTSRLGQIGFAGVAHYTVAKAGLIALTKTLAREFGQQGIRTNAVAPGVTITDMGSQVTEGEVGRKRMAELPLGRFAESHEVANAATFLLSDASAVFLGQTLNANCGGYMG